MNEFTLRSDQDLDRSSVTEESEGSDLVNRTTKTGGNASLVFNS